MKAIVNVNKDWGIGLGGKLLCRFKEDSKYFQDITTGGIIICGRKTFEDFPKGMPLKGRKNIVVTNHKVDEIMSDQGIKNYMSAEINVRYTDTIISNFITTSEDRDNINKDTFVFIAQNPFAAMNFAKTIGFEDNIFVCGGETIYDQLLPYCDTCYVTKNDCDVKADRYFPNLDFDSNWEKVSESEQHLSLNGLNYNFNVYKRIH